MCLWCRRSLLQEMESKTILKGISGVFKPLTTTLVLGPPGCGKVYVYSIKLTFFVFCK